MDIDILLQKLAKPAQRAILGTGVTTLEELAAMREDEIRNLHGIGNNAMQTIKATLEANGYLSMIEMDTAVYDVIKAGDG